MAHEIAKLLLEHAGSFLARSEAVRTAISLGMPLSQIESYLDWLDATRGPLTSGESPPATLIAESSKPEQVKKSHDPASEPSEISQAANGISGNRPR